MAAPSVMRSFGRTRFPLGLKDGKILSRHLRRCHKRVYEWALGLLPRKQED